MVIDSFEPITWFRKVDERFGPLNGIPWRERWQGRMRSALAEQTVLVGELDGEIVAYASGTIDAGVGLGFIDLLAVDRRFQGRGYGREMLRGMLAYMKEQGCGHVNLDCLEDNAAGNSLYRSEGFVDMAHSVRWMIKL